MDLSGYFQKIREIEAAIMDIVAIIVSLKTPDGGKAGAVTEVPAGVAAKMIVEGTARLAKPEEAKAFREQQAEAKKAADQLAAANKVRFSVLAAEDLDKLKAAARPSKG